MKLSRLSTKDILNIAALYLTGYTSTYIAQKYGMSGVYIRYLLKKNKIQIRSQRKDYFNENYFENINSEEKAYWLGFLYADGNVYNNSIRIELIARDKDHLEKFLTCVNSSSKLYYRKSKDSFKISLFSPKMAQDLAKLGCLPNKSRIIKVPNLPESLLNHFFRGFFDGDGWITKRNFPTYFTWYAGVLSVSEDFIKEFFQYFYTKVQKGSMCKTKKDAFQISFSGVSSCCLFLNELYKNASIFLTRKHNLYQELLKNKKEKYGDVLYL